MRRVIAVTACGFALAACTMSMPSLDYFKSAPPTETLRIESEPPGADARTSQGQNCRTPCELTVPAGGELQPATPPRPGKKGPSAKKKTTAARTAPAPSQGNASEPNAAYPAGYPWPPAPQ
jgi:hypothetical protein